MVHSDWGWAVVDMVGKRLPDRKEAPGREDQQRMMRGVRRRDGDARGFQACGSSCFGPAGGAIEERWRIARIAAVAADVGDVRKFDIRQWSSPVIRPRCLRFAAI
ncbi:MAG: hypothetical protein CVT74_14730 [Alphaproteobacteria bacterium HGW-Alphaproteobacteria-13]|nr:MAG: hypothetical protein CVT74_14730 [Alphaproteobacteria bacterium HGW-Alphaproteobacteria-13]